MTFREKIKRVFSRPSSSGSREPELKQKLAPSPSPAQPTNHSAPCLTTVSVQKTKTNHTTETAREARKREKRERKEQKKRDKDKPKIELYRPYEVPPSKYRGPTDPAHQQRLNAYTINGAASSTRLGAMISPDLSPMATKAVPSRRGSNSSNRVDDDVVPGQPDSQPHLHHPFGQEQGCDGSESEPTTAVDTDGESASRSRLTFHTEKTVVEVETIEDIKAPVTSSCLTAPFSPEQLAEALNATALRA